jgi:hypothetical protein
MVAAEAIGDMIKCILISYQPPRMPEGRFDPLIPARTCAAATPSSFYPKSVTSPRDSAQRMFEPGSYRCSRFQFYYE